MDALLDYLDDGRQAIERFRGHAYDAVLSDLANAIGLLAGFALDAVLGPAIELAWDGFPAWSGGKGRACWAGCG